MKAPTQMPIISTFIPTFINWQHKQNWLNSCCRHAFKPWPGIIVSFVGFCTQIPCIESS